MFYAFKWIAFPERVIYQKAIQLFKTIRVFSAEYVEKLFTFESDINARR